MTILPEERRRKKLRNAIEQYIDNLLFNEYEIWLIKGTHDYFLLMYLCI